MSSKNNEYIDASKQENIGGYVDVTKDTKPMSKEQEALAESSRMQEANASPPPTYTTTDEPAKHLKSLEEEVVADMDTLLHGDPDETVSVPMIHTSEQTSLRGFFKGKGTKITQTVIVRKMPRSWYLKHYAHNAEGKYIGTEKPAVDAGLVFVPSKSTSEDIMLQVRKVAFGKEHHINDFGTWAGGAGMGVAMSLQ
ncbi:hypothetical protein CC78DRAFT_570261 [Lojkania enalia]|uniref:Uncharacterized protein n=1 Tax=Lojkania enalia TaxID=147567 RepID=A0A9P4K384_9PLEO|nr:hypothetical protein CC78DRAFT_570261 [Didymosphaeria enalia]